jgi:predicted Zn-dependent protease
VRIALYCVFWIALGAQAFSQDLSTLVLRHCGAPQVTTGAEVERLHAVSKKVVGAAESTRVKIVLIDSMQINAWTARVDVSRTLICIPITLVQWQQGAEGELAFVVGHEIGHTTDESCSTSAARSQMAQKSHSVGALLFGPSSGNERGDQRKCELRADAIGLDLMVRAGYGPEGAVAAFERLRAWHRDHRKGLFGRMVALGDDHPITSDRIRQLKRLIAEQPRS